MDYFALNFSLYIAGLHSIIHFHICIYTKQSKLDEQDTQDTAEEGRASSYGHLHTDEQVLDDQPEFVYNSSVRTHDVIWKTFQKRWTIETNGERERERERERLENSCQWYEKIMTIYIYHDHRQVVLAPQTSLTYSLAFHPYYPLLLAGLLSYIQCPYGANGAFDGQPTLACLYIGVYKWTPPMISSLFFQLCTACPVHLIWMVCKMGGK